MQIVPDLLKGKLEQLAVTRKFIREDVDEPKIKVRRALEVEDLDDVIDSAESPEFIISPAKANFYKEENIA